MSKKTQALKTKYDLFETKSLDEAVKILPEISTSKFVGSVDIDIKLNLKDKQKKESLKGSITLPHSVATDTKVIVLANENDAKKAKKAGASDAGLEDLKKKILDNDIDFDVLIATPDVMGNIVELGKVLGPKGLMPNPKTGTVTPDVEKAVTEFKKGKMNFQMTPGQGTVKAQVAKLDQSPEQIEENVTEFVKAVLQEARKFGGNPIKQVLLKPSMGPGVKLDISDIIA